ncbi:unnamed protein product [Miscanthus lutarioriparius]|uniref:Uncharacterized protein n=1 Tax=Miscanthus lutarioriparius TaxID=422564 RepID=A0A811QPS2_9POAL|nr:unnamed protein product [Miscanthus lutarioriparius]
MDHGDRGALAISSTYIYSEELGSSKWMQLSCITNRANHELYCGRTDSQGRVSCFKSAGQIAGENEATLLASNRPGKSNAVLRLYKSYLTLSTRHGMTSEQFKVAFLVFVLSTLFVPGAKHDHVCVDYWGAHHVFIYVTGQTTTSILNCSHQLATSSRTLSQDADTEF